MESNLLNDKITNVSIAWNEDKESGKYELVFKLPKGDKILSLTCDNVEEIKSFYNSLIEELLEKNVKFNLENISDDDCKKDVYKMAAKEYIRCLEDEFTQIKKEYEKIRDGSLQDIK